METEDISMWSPSSPSNHDTEGQLFSNLIDVQQEMVPEEAFPDMKTWLDFGQSIVRDQSPIQWQVGNWLVVGEKLFGRKAYTEAELLTGYSRRTLYDLAWIVKHVSLRNEKLSWSHHKAIAHLPPERQTEWLDRAQVGNLTVRDLRRSIRCQEPLPTGRSGSSPGSLETERLLDLLAGSRSVTVRMLKQTIIKEYLERPEIVIELESAKATAQCVAYTNRKIGRERWQVWVTRTVDDLLSRLEDDRTDPEGFVTMWQTETGRKFTRSVFLYAMKHTELSADYSGFSSADFGLDIDPPVHVRPSKRNNCAPKEVPLDDVLVS